MTPGRTLYMIRNWRHDARRRKHRWRCQECRRIIADGNDVVIERRPGGSHGYHHDCFDAGQAAPFGHAAAAAARAEVAP